MHRIYYKFSDYLKERYKTKVYKLPVNIPCSCPNRDGTKGRSGCIFCSYEGAGFETHANTVPVSQQLKKNMQYIGEKYKADKFIAYFQNYSNTYLPFENFKKFIKQSIIDNIVAVYISTRPDCFLEKHAEFLNEIKEQHNVDIVVELGLQSSKNSTLEFLNRQHTVEDFIDSIELIKKYNLMSCAHVINDIPKDSIEDVINTAKLLSDLKVDQVKCHSLYVLKGTKLGSLYENKQLQMLTIDQFIERTITFLEHLNKDMIIQRLIGRAPKEKTLFCNYGRNWRYIVDTVTGTMERENRYQGRRI